MRLAIGRYGRAQLGQSFPSGKLQVLLSLPHVPNVNVSVNQTR